jgi:hypothetical protein
MAAESGPDPTPAVAIRVTRSGGVTGMLRVWRVESFDPDGWQPLVDACPWDDGPRPATPDRFVWRIEVRAPEPTREAELPETAVEGPWRELVDRVREEGEAVPPPPRGRNAGEHHG